MEKSLTNLKDILAVNILNEDYAANEMIKTKARKGLLTITEEEIEELEKDIVVEEAERKKLLEDVDAAITLFDTFTE